MRRFQQQQSAALCRRTSCAVALRTMIVFSEQAAELAAIQTRQNWKSNVWVEKGDLKYLGLPPMTLAPSFDANALKVVELFNERQLESGLPIARPNTTIPTSYATKKPYSSSVMERLNDIARKHKYDSPFWISPGSLRTMTSGVHIKRNERPHQIFLMGRVSVYNAEQFPVTAGVHRTIVSGGSKKFMHHSPVGQELQAYCLRNNYSTGLFFSERQFQSMQLKLKAGEAACEVRIPSRNGTLWNSQDLTNRDALMSGLNRFPTDLPTMLRSGVRLPDDVVERIAASGVQYTDNYWVSTSDLFLLKSQLKAGAKHVQRFDNQLSTPVKFYNAEQFENPTTAFRLSGNYVYPRTPVAQGEVISV